MESESQIKLRVEPVTKNNRDQFVKLFGEKGACCNCWCMFYRLSSADFKAGQADNGNKRSMEKIIRADKPAGLLGFIDNEPVAWCAFAPREDFIRLEKSRVHKRIDDKDVWSVPCFFIHKKYRGSGISVLLLKGAIDYAKKNGIKILEAYPVIPGNKKIPASFAWFGLYKAFERTGFKIVDRTSLNRPMVRYYI